MRILIISPTQSGIGGVAQHVKGLREFLEFNGNQVEIISSENTLTIPIKGLKNPSFMLTSFIKARSRTQDIVHAHNIPAALAMRNAAGRKILSLHGVFSEQIAQLHGGTTGKLSRRYEEQALEWADAITVVSKEALDYYSSLGYRVSQIPNAINISSLSRDEDRRYSRQVIFAGRLSSEKGTETLISIGQRLPSDIRLVILGKGPEEEKIRELAKGRENIHYLGYQNKKETISLIRGSDVLVQPSINEGISSTILESMACKTAVIASNAGGNTELIQDGVNGIIEESGDSDSFVRQIVSLFEDSTRRKALQDQAIKTVERYDWRQVGRLYLDIYESVLGKSGQEIT